MFGDNELNQAVQLVNAARQLLGFNTDMLDGNVNKAVNETVLNVLEAANKILKPVDTPTNTP